MTAHRYEGGCLCGAVRYAFEGPVTGINVCHCRQCRKANGTAFATNAGVPRAAFDVVAGADHLAAFESSPGKRRRFCRNCGSPLYSESDASPDIVYVRIGTVDAPDGLTPDVHIHVASKAPWYDIPDDLPQRQAEEDLWF